MKKQPICEECEYKYSYIGSEAELSYAMQERQLLLSKVKETLQNIQFYQNTSNALKRQNSDLMNDVQSMKAVIKEHRAKEYNENLLSERNYRELIEGNKTLEDKLVKLKIEYATKAQEIEELKDTIDKVNSSLKVKDSEIMRLNKELERIHISLSESDEPSHPSRQSFPSSPQAQSPKQAIYLKKRN